VQQYTPKDVDDIHETYCINVVDSDGHDAKFVGLWIAWRFSCVYIPTEAAELTFVLVLRVLYVAFPPNHHERKRAARIPKRFMTMVKTHNVMTFKHNEVECKTDCSYVNSDNECADARRCSTTFT